MVKDNKVLIKYTNRNLANKYGTRPIKTSESFAKSLESKGWAIILNTPPQANPTLTKSEIEEIKKKYEEDAVAFMQEDRFLTKISWIFGDFVDFNIRKIGYKCGFRITQINPVSFTPGKLLLSDMVVVSSNLKGFTDLQMVQIKSVLFQKSVPFVFRIENDNIFEDETMKHFIMSSKMNFFVNEYLFDKAVSELGELFADRWFIEESDGYKFWKKMEELRS